MMMNNHFLFQLMTILFLMNGCNSGNKATGEPEIRPVKFATVAQAGGIKERTYTGITQSSSLTDLSFRSGGLLVRLNAKVGEKVKKGSLLAQLDQKDAKLAYEQAMVDVKNARAQFDAAASGFERVKKLYETNNASLSDYEASKSTYSSAQSAYEISLKRLDLQQSKVDYTEIIAPMNGIVSAVNAEINEVVQSGRTVIVMSRKDENDMEVQVGVPEQYISDIQNGDEVTIKISSIDEPFNGLVKELSYTSSSTGVTYPVTVSLEGGNNPAVRPDMPAEVTFRLGSNDEQSFLVAPLKAVSSGVDGNFVFKLVEGSEEGHYEVRSVPVELGTITKDGYIIRTGLNAGDLVAVAGLRSLYEGRMVTLLKEE